MPIYEYYCPDNHTVYQFYAKTLAQGQTVPKCPANPAWRMEKIVSRFAVASGSAAGERGPENADGNTAGGTGGEGNGPVSSNDARMDAAMQAMEREFSHVDENDPRAMGRMMRRMAELTGEKIDGEMEEVVRKLEEGQDPESLEEQFGDAGGEDAAGGGYGDDDEGGLAPENAAAGSAPVDRDGKPKAPRPARRPRTLAPRRDPGLYDYE
ncbi:FmdB family transcriptional regulator [Opitutaceae bacterium TAV5]|nr:FmdB family transcriptional regulator [Opitutaceae bacterium TAV5]